MSDVTEGSERTASAYENITPTTGGTVVLPDIEFMHHSVTAPRSDGPRSAISAS